MRILHILAQLPGRTGSGVYFANLIKELGRYGHEQRAVFALQDDHCFEHLPADRQYPVRFKTDELPFAVPGMSDVMPYDSTRYCDLTSRQLELWLTAFRRALEKAAADFRPEALVLHHLWILTSLALEVFPGVRGLGVCHYTDLRQAMRNPELKNRYVTNIPRLDAILSLSDRHRAEIRGLHPGEGPGIVATGGGFDESLFFPAPGPRAGGPVRILYAGKIDPSKGVFALIEAFTALRKREPDLELRLVGTPTREHAARMERLLEAGAGLSLSPAVPQERLADLMREHDVFVLPSFFEGLGLSAVEALASGLWTVATENEGLRSLLGERVVGSGAVEFVKAPEMERPGVPRADQTGPFGAELAAKLSQQAARARAGLAFPPNVRDEISKHSWRALAARINGLLA